MLHSPVSVPVSVSENWDHCRMHETRHAALSLILLLLLLLFSLLWLLYGSCFFPPRSESPILRCTGELLRSV